MPKPRARSAAGSRKPRTAGPAPRTRKTTKAAPGTAKPKPRRRKPAANCLRAFRGFSPRELAEIMTGGKPEPALLRSRLYSRSLTQ